MLFLFYLEISEYALQNVKSCIIVAATFMLMKKMLKNFNIRKNKFENYFVIQLTISI